MDPEEPSYEHNCSRCVFLGGFEFEDLLWDLYFCRDGEIELETVIARRSSDPHDYTGGLQLASYDPVLREARERARERGLLPLAPEPDPFR
jgi:hypothetical protein